MNLKTIWLASLFAMLVISGCGGDSGGSVNTPPIPNPLLPGTVPAIGARDIQISWVQNNEVGVNQAGGGYDIFFLNAPTDLIGAALSTVNIPYVSGAAAPTTYTGNFATGEHYFKIQAYSSTGRSSQPTTGITLYVP